MLCRTVGALAALSVGANGILLPPGISKISDSRSDAFGLSVDPKSQLIKVPCPGCAFSSNQQESAQAKDEGDGLLWIQGGANDVLFNFTVSNDKDLLMNGVKLYPIDGPSMEEPMVGQVRASASLVDIKKSPEQVTPLRVSAAGIAIHQSGHVSAMDDKVVSINYQIAELDSQSISVDGVEVKLLESQDGSLMIMSAEAVPRDHLFDMLPPHIKNGKSSRPAEKECSMLPASLCKLKSTVEDKFSGFKPAMGCGGRAGGRRPHRMPGHIRPQFDKDGKLVNGNPRPHHGSHGSHHHGPHHHGHEHHVLGRFLHAFVAVIIPVMAGISLGMFVGLLGMLVGRLISFVWIHFARGGQRGYASVAQSEEGIEAADKIYIVEEVIEEEEPLPQYEDAPAYNEKEQQ